KSGDIFHRRRCIEVRRQALQFGSAEIQYVYLALFRVEVESEQRCRPEILDRAQPAMTVETHQLVGAAEVEGADEDVLRQGIRGDSFRKPHALGQGGEVEHRIAVAHETR